MKERARPEGEPVTAALFRARSAGILWVSQQFYPEVKNGIRLHREAQDQGRPALARPFPLGGADTPLLFGGSFRTKKEAQGRRDVIAGDLAVLRVPDLRLIDLTAQAPTLIERRGGGRQAAWTWQRRPPSTTSPP